MTIRKVTSIFDKVSELDRWNWCQNQKIVIIKMRLILKNVTKILILQIGTKLKKVPLDLWKVSVITKSHSSLLTHPLHIIRIVNWAFITFLKITQNPTLFHIPSKFVLTIKYFYFRYFRLVTPLPYNNHNTLTNR